MTATFTHSVSSTALASAITHTVTMADADFQTLVNFLIAKYTTKSMGISGFTSNVPTAAQAIQMWLQEAYARTLDEEATYRTQKQTPPAATPLAITLT